MHYSLPHTLCLPSVVFSAAACFSPASSHSNNFHDMDEDSLPPAGQTISAISCKTKPCCFRPCIAAIMSSKKLSTAAV
eukprot:IDg20287t1